MAAAKPLQSAAETSGPLRSSPRPRRPLRASDTAETNRPSLLVLDPDERSRSVLAVGLLREGFDVIGVASAAEAWRYLAPEHALPAMIFCEAELRDGDGFTFCAQLRAEPRTHDLPVVLLARNADDWHRSAAGGAGADELLCKPLFLGDVVALALLLAGRSSVASRYEADSTRLPLHRTVRALLTGVRSGRVELADGEGFVAFRQGTLIDAAFGSARGEVAVDGLLRWARGEYAVVFGEAPEASDTMGVDAQTFCREHLPRLERWQSIAAASVPFDAVLSVDFARLAEAMATLSADAHELLRAVDGERDVEGVLRATPMDAMAALELLTALHAEGVLVAAGASSPADPPRALDDALRLQLEAFRSAPSETSGRRNQPVGPQREVVGPQKKVVGPQNEAVGPRNEVVGPRNEAVGPQNEAVGPRNEVVGPRNEAVGPRNEAVGPRNEVVGPRNEVVGRGNEAVGRGNEAVGRGSEASAPAAAPPPRPEASPVPDKTAAAPAEVARLPPPAAVAIADEDEDLRALLPPSRSRLPLYVGGALVVLIAAGLFLARPSTEPAPVPPPSPVVEVEAPPEAAPPVVISEAPPTEPVVEIEAPQPEAAAELAEGIRHYESGRFRQAVAVLEPATVRDAEAVQPWLYLGLARFEVGDRAGAEVAVQRVLAREPRNGRAIMLLATLHLDQGRKEEARAQLRRYLELYPDGPHARDAQRLLR